MNRNFYLIVLLCSYLATYSANAQIQSTTFDKITVKDGLSHSTVTSIIQDKTGFIWFATYYGINRYDGHTIKTYISKPDDSTSLYHNGVTYLYEDNDGYIWAINSSTTAGIERYNPMKDNFTRFSHNPLDSTSISSNTIYHIIQDKAGSIWISTSNALNLLQQQNNGNITFKRIYYPEDFTQVTWLHENNQGQFLLFSDSLVYFNRETEHFRATEIPLTESRLISLAEDDSTGTIYLGYLEDGLVKLSYNTKSKHYERSPLEKLSRCDDSRNIVLFDHQKQLWIGTENKGLFKYDETTDSLINFVHNDLDPGSISENYINSLSIDNSGILWIGTTNQGVCNYDLYSKKFYHIKSVSGNPRSLSNNAIVGIDGNTARELWVGTAGGVNRLTFNQDYAIEAVTKYYNIPGDQNSLASNNTLSLVQRKNGDVWVGSNTNALSRFITGNSGNARSVSVRRYPVEGWTFTLFEDSDSILWGGTWGNGLWKYIDSTNTFAEYQHEIGDSTSICEDVIWAIGEDKYKNLWIGGNSEGLSILPASEKGKADPEFVNFRFDKDNPKSLSNNSIHAILQDRDGTMWIATSGGLNHVSDRANYLQDFEGNPTLEFTGFGTEDGLSSEGIIGIAQDAEGNLWLATSKGISKFDLKDSTFYNFSESDGLVGDEFLHNAYYKNPEGRIFFGTANGITMFDPKDIEVNPFIPKIVITDLKVFNQSVKIGQEINNDVILNEPVFMTKEITISYKNNKFTIEFAALHYAEPGKNQFAYRLEGYEENWNYVENEYTASYSNLDAGTYTFRVKGSNNNGIWNETGTYLNIRVKSPWWETWWFRILIFSIAVFIFYMIHFIRISQIRRRKIILEQKVKERTREIDAKNKLLVSQSDQLNETNTLLEERQQQIEEQAEELISANDQLTLSNNQLNELNSMKDKIISIIGHDLKNPINTIMGFAELLKIKGENLIPEKRNDYVNHIHESVNKTYQLLESLLNWARSQNAHAKFNPQELQLNQLITDSVLILKEQALKKNITITFENDNKEYLVFCDKKMIETVLRNLISNAIKFTKPGGNITISSSLDENKNFCTIQISDTGLGISKDQQSTLFQIDKSISTVGTDGETGTGLGLVLCKEFIERNKGEIWVESEEERGTTFSFSIPLNINAF